MMNVYDEDEESEIDTLLAQVDPFNNKKMTYSEIVVGLEKKKLIIKFNQVVSSMVDDDDDGLRMGHQADANESELPEQPSEYDNQAYAEEDEQI